MLNISGRITRAILKPISRGVTAFVALYTMIWGFWVFNPWWHVFNSADLYDGLRSFAPEWFWGFFALFSGFLSLITVIDARYPKTAFISAAVTGWFWLVIGILYFYGDWHNTGGITAMFLSILCSYIYLNVKANGGYK